MWAITRTQILQLHRRNNGRVQAEGGSDACRLLEAVADPAAEPCEEDSVELGELYLRALELVRSDAERRFLERRLGEL